MRCCDTTGKLRRWVYLHYFKSGQPSINWLDPTFSGMRLVIGDAMHSLVDLGPAGLRLDANGFLGVEKSAEEQPAWSEGHPLSQAANQLIGSMVRKVGGFTFQELNLTIDDIKATSKDGPDLSYDFITRPAYHHAFVTGDTEFLRLTLRAAHADRHRPGLTGPRPAEPRRDDLRAGAFRHQAQGRALQARRRGALRRGAGREYSTDAAGQDHRPGRALQPGLHPQRDRLHHRHLITAALGIADPAPATDEQVDEIRRVHLLLAMYNALQPGVFALSGWDLCGICPLDRSKVARLIARATPAGSTAARTT